MRNAHSSQTTYKRNVKNIDFNSIFVNLNLKHCSTLHYIRVDFIYAVRFHHIQLSKNQFDGLIIAQDMDTSYKFISTYHHYYGLGYVIIIIYHYLYL